MKLYEHEFVFMFMPDFQYAAVPRPKQHRSEQRLQRILDAARVLLEEKTFEQLTIREIASAAKCSVGTFYQRFADKHALLDSLDELYSQDLISEFEALADGWASGSLDLRDKILQASTFLVQFHRARRGVARALILEARLRPQGAFGARTKQMISLTPGITRSILRHTDEINHTDARRAARFAFVQALTTVREFVIFPEGPASAQPISDRALAKEVARSWHLYLTFTPIEE